MATDATAVATEAAAAPAAAEAAKKALVKVDPPNKEKFDANTSRLTKEIEKLEKEAATLTKEIDGNTEARQSCRTQKAELFAKLKASKQARDALYKERDHFSEEIAKIDTERKERRDAVQTLRAKLQYLTVEEIQAAISKIQFTMSTSTVSLKREKQMIQDMNELEKQKALVHDYVEAKKKSEDDQSDSSEFKAKRDEKSKAVKEIKAAEEKLEVVLAEIRNKETEMNNTVKNSVQKRKTITATLRDLKKELATMNAEYMKQDRAYERYKEELKYVKRVEARKQRAIQNAEYKKELEAKDAEEAERHPYEVEMVVCEELLRYLNRLAPNTNEQSADAGGVDASTVLANERASAFGGKQVQPFKKKTDDDDVFFSAVVQQKKKKDKKKGNKKAAGDEALTHIPEVFKQFERLSLAPPLNRDAVPASLKQLQEKLAYFRTAPPPLSKAEKKAAKAADASATAAATATAAGAKLAPDQKARIEQLRKENDAADEAAEMLRAAGRRQSLAALETEQARRVNEIAQIQREAEEEAKRERQENQERATKAMDEEQARRVREYNDDGGSAAERGKNIEAARRAGDEEQKRRVEAEQSANAKAEEEERASRESSRRMSIEMAEAERARRIAEGK